MMHKLIELKETWCGLFVAVARRVIEIELVLDAKIADPLTILSNSANSFFFTSSFSTIASITISAERRSSRFEVYCRRAIALFPTACQVNFAHCLLVTVTSKTKLKKCACLPPVLYSTYSNYQIPWFFFPNNFQLAIWSINFAKQLLLNAGNYWAKKLLSCLGVFGKAYLNSLC